MQQANTLIHCKTIITANSSEQVLTDHTIIIGDGKILDILPTSEAKLSYLGQTIHSYDHHIVIPGLINTHTHAAMSLFRGLANDLPLMEWLQNHIWPKEQKWVNEEFVQIGSQLAIAEMLRGGVTCFNDMYFYSETTAQVASNSGIRAHIGMILLDFPTQYAKDADEYFTKGLALHDQYKSHPLVKLLLHHMHPIRSLTLPWNA